MARCWCMRCAAASGKPHASASGGKMWPWQSTMSKSRVMFFSGAVVGIEMVAQPVAEDVAREDEERDGDAGRNHEMRRHLEELAPSGKHGAPFRRGRLHPKAEETERRADEHRLPREEARLDHDYGERVRQHVAREDADIAHADGDRRLHVFFLADLEHAPADESRKRRHE